MYNIISYYMCRRRTRCYYYYYYFHHEPPADASYLRRTTYGFTLYIRARKAALFYFSLYISCYVMCSPSTIDIRRRNVHANVLSYRFAAKNYPIFFFCTVWVSLYMLSTDNAETMDSTVFGRPSFFIL